MTERRDRALRLEVVEPAMVAVLGAKTGSERLAMASGMFRSARQLLSSHLRCEHPEWTEKQLRGEVAHRLSRGTG
jgi:hypothetical protein